jgi:2-hydroxychromene-2-carboxylate isomerase
LGRACWAEERDISDEGVIGDCLEACGFPRSLTTTGLLAAAETYARNLNDALADGVFGFPFFVVGGERFWGQDRLEMLDLHLAGRL